MWERSAGAKLSLALSWHASIDASSTAADRPALFWLWCSFAPGQFQGPLKHGVQCCSCAHFQGWALCFTTLQRDRQLQSTLPPTYCAVGISSDGFLFYNAQLANCDHFTAHTWALWHYRLLCTNPYHVAAAMPIPMPPTVLFAAAL